MVIESMYANPADIFSDFRDRLIGLTEVEQAFNRIERITKKAAEKGDGDIGIAASAFAEAATLDERVITLPPDDERRQRLLIMHRQAAKARRVGSSTALMLIEEAGVIQGVWDTKGFLVALASVPNIGIKVAVARATSNFVQTIVPVKLRIDGLSYNHALKRTLLHLTRVRKVADEGSFLHGLAFGFVLLSSADP